MNYKKISLLPLLCMTAMLVFLSSVRADENTVSVTITKPEHGALELRAVTLDNDGYVTDIKAIPLVLPYAMKKDVETCAVICLPEKGYVTEKMTYSLTKKDGTKEDLEANIKERKDKAGNVVYRFALLRFKAESPVTSCVINAQNKLNAAQITFKEPSVDDGTLEVSYMWNGEEQKVKSKDVAPLDTDLVLLLTSKDPKRRPNVSYKEVGTENVKPVEVKYYSELKVWRGVLRIQRATEIIVKYGPDDLMVTFVSPTADKGSLDITYQKDGEEKRLITSGKVLRDTELTLKLTRKKESFELKVNYKGEDGKLTPVELSEQADKSFVGKIVVKSDIQIFTSFEDTNTAIAEQVWEGVEVYPNPFAASLTIKNPSVLVGRYELVTLQGQTVRAGEIQSSELSIDTEELPLGIYFARLVAASGETRIVRLVKY